MRKLFHSLWEDDDGFIIAVEYILIATIIILGLVVGLASVRDAIVSELSELGNSYMALSQGYVLSGQSGCCTMVDGSQACDTPNCRSICGCGNGYGYGQGYGYGPNALYYGNGCCDGLWGGYQGGWNGSGGSGCNSGCGNGCGSACNYEHCLPTN